MPLDAAVLARLIENHAGALQLWVRTRCASSEDVVQEAFCRLAVQQPAPEKPVAWLYRVCRNLADKQRVADERRRKREQACVQAEVATTAPADPLEIAEAIAAVEQLDSELREVLVARLWGQLTLAEVGALCGVSTATAQRRYEAAIKALRSQLEPKHENRP